MRAVVTAMRAWGEMVKFSHSVFALPFAVLATFLAARPGLPSVWQFLLIIVCMVAARSAAMTFNRIVDARLDADNPRTAGRQLVTGAISRRAAWGFFLIAGAVFVIGCAGFLVFGENYWPLALAGPVLAYLCFYSYTKRFTRWSHVVLGSAIALSPAAAWIAISPATLGWPAGLLVVAVMFWIGGFDVIYACQDAEYDRRVGLHSIPSRMGIAAALWLARGFHVITVAALVGVGVTAGLGAPYFGGVACVVVLLIVENAIVRPNDLSRVNVAFFTINGVVGLVLGGLGVLDVCLHVTGS